MTDLDVLGSGRVVLHKHQMAVCEACGATIASHALLRRIEASLGGSDEAMRTVLSRYCPSCRLSFAPR
jgi:Fe2+ or Zn2+ uptake regulation protein